MDHEHVRACVAQLVYETSLGTPDDEALQDLLLQRAAEKDPDYFGPQLSQVRQLPRSSRREAQGLAVGP